MKDITIKGKKYPCYTTMGAMVRFKSLAGKDVSQINATDVTENLQLMYCMVQSASKVESVEFSMSFEDFADCLLTKDFVEFNKALAEETESKKK